MAFCWWLKVTLEGVTRLPRRYIELEKADDSEFDISSKGDRGTHLHWLDLNRHINQPLRGKQKKEYKSDNFRSWRIEITPQMMVSGQIRDQNEKNSVNQNLPSSQSEQKDKTDF